jgi:hypothetical protein
VVVSRTKSTGYKNNIIFVSRAGHLWRCRILSQMVNSSSARVLYICSCGSPIFRSKQFLVEETGCKLKNIGVGIIQIGPFCELKKHIKDLQKVQKNGFRLHTLQIFDLLQQLTEWTNLDDFNGDIFYFASGFFHHNIVWI